MNNKQMLLNIIMDAIDSNSDNIAILVKYKNKNRNTVEIEPKENITNILKEITNKEIYDDSLVSESKTILSAVAFNNEYTWDEIIEALRDNIFNLTSSM